MMLLVAGLGLREFYGLVEKRGLICFKEWGVFGGLLLMASTFFYLSGVLGIPPARFSDAISSEADRLRSREMVMVSLVEETD